MHAHNSVEGLEERIFNRELGYIDHRVGRVQLFDAPIDSLEQRVLQPGATRRQRHCELLDDRLAGV